MIEIKNNQKKKIAVAEQWLICSIDGIVVSSTEEFGVGSYAGDYLDPSAVTEFEDLLSALSKGISVSATIPSRKGKAEIKSDCLFSMPVLRITFFDNDRYFTSDERGNVIKGLIDYMSPYTLISLNLLRDLSSEPELSDSIRDKLRDTISSIESLTSRRTFIYDHFSRSSTPRMAYDMSELIRMISSRVAGELPFLASFENCCENERLICTSDPGGVAGIIMMSASIAAGLSGKNKCRISVSGNGESLVMTVGCVIRKTVKMRCSGCDLSKLYEIAPSAFGEVSILESLIHSSGWDAWFSIDSEGSFSICMVCEMERNTDRLKFFDSLAEVPQAIDGYLNFINDSAQPQ